MDPLSATREKKTAALGSVAAAVFLTGLKLAVGLQTNSLGILSEAAHSGLDLLAAVVTYVAIVLAARPPDLEHPYGHGKIENLSALVETFLLFLTCSWIIWEAVGRLVERGTHVQANVWSFAVMGVAIVVDLGRSRHLGKVARRHRSQALEADALHFSSDVWSSLVVIVGLVCVSLGFPAVDSVAAIAVALLVLFVSYRLGRRTVDALVDRTPSGLYEEVLDAVRAVEGVEQVRSIRLRPSGPKVFVDTTVAIRRTTPFERAHGIMDDVERAIHVSHSDVDVVVHAEPLESEDETIVDKVRMIALKKGLRAPHNLEVHRTGGRYFIDFDLEYRKGKSFVEAHEVAAEIEREIHESFEHVEKVTIHLEEYQPDEVELSDATDAEETLRESIRARVLLDERVLGCSDVTLLRLHGAFNVSVTCQVEESRSLDEVHTIVAEMESTLYREFSQLRRVTIRAEPV